MGSQPIAGNARRAGKGCHWQLRKPPAVNQTRRDTEKGSDWLLGWIYHREQARIGPIGSAHPT